MTEKKKRITKADKIMQVLCEENSTFEKNIRRQRSYIMETEEAVEEEKKLLHDMKERLAYLRIIIRRIAERLEKK